ncbi:hypothetical protein DPMN_001083 [Dreissena polymorpha]|uniref:Uncharacterized protein n=1 Tax=Dreissena polymorpha TaxID=45954 RepID=A0A9D4MJ96_DREPO|nr:hypothetical protein DPMN_001083 [Dreissena polymorpha]
MLQCSPSTTVRSMGLSNVLSLAIYWRHRHTKMAVLCCLDTFQGRYLFASSPERNVSVARDVLVARLLV